MTEQSNAEKAHDIGMDAVDWGMVRDGVGDPQEAASIAVRAALATADQRAAGFREALRVQTEETKEVAKRSPFKLTELQLAAVTEERDQFASDVEKVRAWAERNKGMGYGTGTGASALEILDILATAPADALREVKAEAWDEGADAMAEHIDNGAGWEIQNPYREEQS